MPLDLTILMDDREVGAGKRPWALPWPVEVTRLKVGDYTFEGMEETVAIEKKRGLDELFRDLTNGYRPTFKRFLAKMCGHPVRCIVVGEPLTVQRVDRTLKAIRENSRGRVRLTARTIWYWTGEIMGYYGIPMYFLDANTRHYVLPEVFRACWQKAVEL